MTTSRVHEATPVRKHSRHSYCPYCDETAEECQGPEHLGKAKCMECGGGVVGVVDRTCANCVDLPYRRMREAGLGRPIVYTTERPRSHLL